MFMDGGPGFSSAFSVYDQGGPYIINNKTKEIEWNPYAWNNFSDVLFIDQPAGTSFSFANDERYMCRNETCVAQDLYAFLLRFYDTHTIYKGRDLYIGGISYGGHYAPAIAGYLLRNTQSDIKLKGVLVFNGLVDMYIQLGTPSWFLYDNGLISWAQYILYQGVSWVCQIAGYMHIQSFDIPCAYSIFTVFKHANIQKNPYDIQEEPGPDPSVEKLKVYLNEPAVQRALGVNQPFVPSNRTVMDLLLPDFALSLSSELSLALSRGISVYMVYGDKDYVCNWKGGEQVTNALAWSGRDEYLKLPFVEWVHHGLVLGSYRRYQNLAFVKVHNAGHSIMARQRGFGFDILKTWMHLI